MTVTERRIVFQDWYETEYSKSGWDSHGWEYRDEGISMHYSWEIVEILDSDKYGNPLIAIAEKQTEIE